MTMSQPDFQCAFAGLVTPILIGLAGCAMENQTSVQAVQNPSNTYAPVARGAV